jgi:hypothetical protein
MGLTMVPGRQLLWARFITVYWNIKSTKMRPQRQEGRYRSHGAVHPAKQLNVLPFEAHTVPIWIPFALMLNYTASSWSKLIVANTACTADNSQCGVLSLRVALWAGFEANDDNGTSHFLEARKRFPNLVQSRLISDQV